MLHNNFQNLYKREIISLLNKNFKKNYPQNYLNKYIRVNKEILYLGKSKFYLKKDIISIIGFGKISQYLVSDLLKIINQKFIKQGIIITPGNKINLSNKKIKIFTSDHPIPDKKSYSATQMLFKYIHKIPKNNIIIVLISGGGSASLCMPISNVSLNDYLKLTRNLILSEIPIYDINLIRGFYSAVKNGKLADKLYPKKIYNFIVSDDPRDIIQSIGSGSTVYPSKNYLSRVNKVFQKNQVRCEIPKNLLPIKKFYSENNFREKKHTKNIIIFKNSDFLKNLKKIAIVNGFKKIIIYPKIVEGNPIQAKKKILNFVKKNKNSKEKTLLLFGAEIYLKVKNYKKSKGGRLQHLSLIMFKDLFKYLKKFTFFSLATDGKDFIKNNAGVIFDENDCKKFIHKKNNKFLNNCINNFRSNNFFKKFKCMMKLKKPTKNNVMDIIGIKIN